jgi:hypothetical protein
MPYWMIGEHGTHVCYDASDVERHKAMGWRLLNEGEAPDYSAKPQESAPAVAAPVPTLDADLAQDSADSAGADLLSHPVIRILPQLPTMGKLALEALRAEEIAGKNRKGLVLEIERAIERMS